MTKLDKLIQELCPDGVKYLPIPELFITRNGYTPSKANSEFWENGTIPWFRMEDIRENGRILTTATQYVSEKAVKGKLFPADSIIIATSATIGEHALIKVPSLANQRFTYLTLKDEFKDCVDMMFVFYYCFRLDEYCKSHLNQGNFASVDMKQFAAFKFPVPPLPVQREIVRILDNFTELTEGLNRELAAELTARKKQYAYYRDKLLHNDATTVYKRLGDFCDLLSGFPFDSSKFKEDGIRLMRGMNIKRGYLDFTEENNRYWESTDGVEKYLLNDQDIVISMDGSLVGSSYGMVSKKDLPLLLVQRVTRIRTNQANIRYVYHYIASGRFTEYVHKKKTAGAIPHISLKDISNFEVPLPSLEIQKRLVEVLDNFDALCTDLNIGLPAEIEARKKQYEFYRDQLLTFAAQGETILTDRQTDEYSALIRLCQYVFGYAFVELSLAANVFRGEYFKKYNLFGFTGTPIFAVNAGMGKNPTLRTTAQAFGDQLHAYTIVDAINDKNVLPFRVDYIKTMDAEPDIDDKEVWDINREKAFLAPERIRLVTEYILTHFDQKTYRGDKTYTYSVLQNIAEVASAGSKQQIEEIKQKQRVSGFNSIFAVSSVDAAKLYYAEFQRQMAENPQKRLKVAVIYSYGANEEETDGILDEENPEDTSALDQSSRDFLDAAIRDYNGMFHTNYSTDGDKFQNYYKDVSLRMKNKELDLLIVVNMFLTGFDATTLNTLWVDKNLKMHGLIQAYSRTNRILNSIKVFGNIVCFRNLQKRTDDAISLFGDKEAGGIVLMRGYKDYYFGYEDADGKYHPGYQDMIEELTTKFPLTEERITGEQRQKEFIVLFGAILRMRNLLTSFDEFAGSEILSERDFQDYLGRYQDLRDEWKSRKPGGEKEDITDDIVFEIELIKQIEINIDYILLLVQKYHDSHCDDKEILITIQKAVDASPELRSKKALIETFIAGINDVSDVMLEWRTFVAEEKERQLVAIIQEKNLKDDETRRFMESSFRDGSVKTTGTDIDRLMPPISRFGGGNRAEKKQTIIEKLKGFFDRFFGIG